MTFGDIRLAILLDGGGRFVACLRVTKGTNRIVGMPHLKSHQRDNDRMGLVPDRLPDIGRERKFRRRGVHRMPDGDEVIMFKEESA